MADGQAKSGYAETLAQAREKLRELEHDLGIVPIAQNFIGGHAMQNEPKVHKNIEEWLRTLKDKPRITSISVVPLHKLIRMIKRCDGDAKATLFKEGAQMLVAAAGRQAA